MSSQDMNHWRNIVQEAWDGELSMKPVITRNMQQYGREASIAQKAGRPMSGSYPQLKTAADLVHTLDMLIKELSKQPDLEKGLGASILSKLHNVNLSRTALQLDQVAKLPPPKETKP